MYFYFLEGITQENIPLGTWRLHLSYNDLNILADASDRIFATSDVGIMIFDKVNQEIATISKQDGLSSSKISALGYDQQRDLLLIGHQSGLISLLFDNKLSTIDNILFSKAISGSKKINHILVYNTVAYLSTDFGVVVIDLEKKEVKETYRDLSGEGEALIINQSVVSSDTIWLATEKGVVAGSIAGTSNLLDYRNWKHYDQGLLSNNIKAISGSGLGLFIGIDTHGIYKFENSSWQSLSLLQGEIIKHLSSSTLGLVITTDQKVYLYTEFPGVILAEIGIGEFSRPDMSIQSSTGVLWVADSKRGLIGLKGQDVTMIKPGGPSSNTGWRINYLENEVSFAHGGFFDSVQPLNRETSLDQFVAGQWKQLPSASFSDITDFEKIATNAFIASFGSGLEKISDEGTQVFDDSNSPLSKINPSDPFLPITSIEKGDNGLWVANYGSSAPLHLLSNNNTWQSFSFAEPQASYPVDMLVDKSGKTWMIIDPKRGGGLVVYDKSSNSSTYLTTEVGKGGLPSMSVRSIANDRNGNVWVGTDAGVVFYPGSINTFGTNVDPTKPVFENRFLLRDESVTAIAADGGNRKWLGTNNGVWLFNPTGEELIYNFTEQNSPLLSNKIIAIAIDPKSGEVFFSTDQGLTSFRSDATASEFNFDEVKIFPNPVSPEFNGQVAINGLYTDAMVKITDLSGRVVWQTQANGGTAIWNARQLNGNRVSTGMYLVFATSADGTERHVGKIAVVE